MQATLPWHRKTYRWGQIDIVEFESGRVDLESWRQAHLQGLIVHAGDVTAWEARALVAGCRVPVTVHAGWAHLRLDRVADHEVVVVD